MPRGFTGHVRAPNKDHLIALSLMRHGRMLRGLRQDVPAAFDARDKGIIGPIKDQKQCGSCWDFSGTFVTEVAFYLSGILKPDGSQALSEEYTLSCGNNGGCNGDDNTNVLAWAKKTGLPLSSDYGPYTASADRCNWKQGMKLYQIDDWGFADSNGGNGVTPASMIKAAIMAYGCVGCAVAAGGDSFWDSGTGVGTASSNEIDHDVGIIGWDDSKGSISVAVNAAGGKSSLTCWNMRNSWGTSWGNSGYAWVREGAYSLGTEAVWATVKNPNPPPPPALPPDLWS